MKGVLAEKPGVADRLNLLVSSCSRLWMKSQSLELRPILQVVGKTILLDAFAYDWIDLVPVRK